MLKKTSSATAKSKAPKPPKKPYPELGSICAGDFGLKAGFRDPDKGGAVTFRPIVGWVSVVNYIDTARLPFVGVVINDDDTPTMAAQAHMPNFVGYFKNNATAEEARKVLERDGVRVTGVRGAARTVVE
ncbi:MAG TPA: hypothetical protein VE974_01535 [Thermoanaerobaculia bacterium]|nr:hypothetical protein [Thermoanaerobaculia bacterium]